jgi:riboflavin kinase/FMN adenylyltransferase
MIVYHSLEEIRVHKPVVSIGVFDGVHVGHRYLFDRMKEEARRSGGETLVITFWPHPRIVLNHQPEKLKYLSTIQGKQELLEECGIDHLLILEFTADIQNMDARTFVERLLVKKIGVEVLVMGFDHVFGHDRQGDYERVSALGGELGFRVVKVEARKVKGQTVSSTLIRDMLWQGDVAGAKRFLGYYYFIIGRIVGGKRIGRSIGFPTANIRPDDEHKLIPADGVYAVKVLLSGKNYGGMLNIGIRPTVNNGFPEKTIEVHIFDFHGDIYGQDVKITFIERIRPEKKFDRIEELAAQLQEDKKKTMEILEDKGD